jgi:hypothetical protein
MAYNPNTASRIVCAAMNKTKGEKGLDLTFVEVCSFLSQHPDYLSIRGKSKPSVGDKEGLKKLADKYIGGYRRDDTPSSPKTIPDEMVSYVLQCANGYSANECKKIKIEHQHSMSAENCVGALLERYLDSVLRKEGWSWCCGDFVKAVDFLRKDRKGKWQLLQIKNRDNSENSSSSAIRKGTQIEKWFRSFSVKGGTNWDNLPASMQGYGLSEKGFRNFVRGYVGAEMPRVYAVKN